MRRIENCTQNVQQFIRIGLAACKAGREGKNLKSNRLLRKRNKFAKKNFTIEDYDSIIQYTSDSPLEANSWKQDKIAYLEHRIKRGYVLKGSAYIPNDAFNPNSPKLDKEAILRKIREDK
ncbi:MAG TPA: hypothetical protein DCY93_01405 [Firmicutes bacterium]|nr:hypothetical protein [Bacillota bacterium]